MLVEILWACLFFNATYWQVGNEISSNAALCHTPPYTRRASLCRYQGSPKRPPLLGFWFELRFDLMYDKHKNQDVETWYLFLILLSINVLLANNSGGINLSCRCLCDQHRYH